MKVMISLPEKTLRELDRLAREAGESRSATVRRLAEAEAARDRDRRRREVRRLLGDPGHHGGGWIEEIKAQRRAR